MEHGPEYMDFGISFVKIWEYKLRRHILSGFSSLTNVSNIDFVKFRKQSDDYRPNAIAESRNLRQLICDGRKYFRKKAKKCNSIHSGPILNIDWINRRQLYISFHKRRIKKVIHPWRQLSASAENNSNKRSQKNSILKHNIYVFVTQVFGVRLCHWLYIDIIANNRCLSKAMI